MFSEKLVAVDSYEVDPHQNYTLFKLHTKEGTIPLYTTSSVQNLLKKNFSRPHAHDIIASVIQGFDLNIQRCIIDHVEDSVYYAKLFIEQQKKQIVSIDIRPSDVILLLRYRTFPIYVAQKVLDIIQD